MAGFVGIRTPVLIDAEAGGAVAQLFLYPPGVTAGRDFRHGALACERRAFIIRNARLEPEWAAVDRRIFPITGRAITSMIHDSVNSDILRPQNTSARDGVDFNPIFIGEDFAVEHTEHFDAHSMRTLFDYA